MRASVIAHSVSARDIELLTFELVYPRFIHSEFMTHRVFSRNASSSRATPTKKLIEIVRQDPVMPIHWGKNQPGMQASEVVDTVAALNAEIIWRNAAFEAAAYAESMLAQGIHKQDVNRILEPFLPIRVVCTATDFANFYALRDHEDAQPEIRQLARLMWAAADASTPTELAHDEWHLPYISRAELAEYCGPTDPTGNLRLVSAARCARVSYKTHDGRVSELEEEMALCQRLIQTDLIHASPFEHQAKPDRKPFGLFWMNKERHGNLRGWQQHRKFLANEFVRDR